MFKLGRKKTGNNKVVCLHFSNEGIAIAVNLRKSGTRTLLSSQFFSHTDLKNSPLIIQDFINTHKLAKFNCTIILPASSYQMLLVEAPNVSPPEMTEALWWKVKDLVNVDYDNAQTDYLDLPEDITQQQGKKVYAIVADREKTKEKIIFAKKLGLIPTTVETPETALLHLTRKVCSDIIGTSALYVNKEQSLLTLMSDSKLYLSRSLQYNYLERSEAVALDLQRSMDYYESQLGKPPCLKIIVFPQQDLDSEIMSVLSNNTNATIETIDLNDIVKSQNPISRDSQQHCFVAIAGILRSDKKALK